MNLHSDPPPSLDAGTAASTPLADIPTAVLEAWTREARDWTLIATEACEEAQLLGPELSTVNPLLWEVGHVAWFQERWVLRQFLGKPARYQQSDDLYNSSTVDHRRRWNLPLLSRQGVLQYLRDIRDATLDTLATRDTLDPESRKLLTYFCLLSISHEDMHHEAFAYTRQTQGWSPPPWIAAPVPIALDPTQREPAADSTATSRRIAGDVEFEGGSVLLGCDRPDIFSFDNEQPGVRVQVAPFRMSCHTVTEGEFLEFVEAQGYRTREYWCDDGWRWLQQSQIEAPTYWRRAGRQWQRRRYDQWIELRPQHPMLHVSWFEANAYCRFAQRRLPTEAEWTFAARSTHPQARFPWGNDRAAEFANLDGRVGDTVEVGHFDRSSSGVRCQQLIGNVWEWTADPFTPFPGFQPGHYEDYSQPWFHDHKLLKGGCWHTRSRLINCSYRNFYKPDRRDIWVGFRTCPVEPTGVS